MHRRAPALQPEEGTLPLVRTLIRLLTACFILLAASCEASRGAHPPASPRPCETAQTDTERPERIILMIGDGFGTSHLTALSLALREHGGPTLEKLPVAGLVRTSSANRIVTDSGAAASAFATGHRVNNQALSLTHNGAPLRTIAEQAKSVDGESVW